MSQGFGLKERAIPNTNPNKSVRAFRMFQLQSTPEGELEDAPVEQEPSMSSSDKDIAAEVFARFSTDGEVLQESELRSALGEMDARFKINLDVDYVVNDLTEALEGAPTLEVWGEILEGIGELLTDLYENSDSSDEQELHPIFRPSARDKDLTNSYEQHEQRKRLSAFQDCVRQRREAAGKQAEAEKVRLYSLPSQFATHMSADCACVV